MTRNPTILLLACTMALLFAGCADEGPVSVAPEETPPDLSLAAVFGAAIDLNNLPNYADQPVPRYIRKNNAGGRPVTDAGATLGRVLFYDKNLSVDGTISCASCHQQGLAFGDDEQASTGLAGQTERHSMRLVNIQFATETHMFWNERAASLEEQILVPIQDPVEMGFTGEEGAPGFDALLARLQGIAYYRELFAFAFGDSTVTDERLQDALAQFVRSIRSFDSKYDAGRALQPDDREPFPNFTDQENFGKELFFTPPALDEQSFRISGGLACAGCHRGPEFDIDPEMQNNGVIRTISGIGTDQFVTRAPTLRNVVKADGSLNGPLMHTGDFDLDEVLDHYDQVPSEGNTNLDNRLNAQGHPQRLFLTEEEREAVKAFLRTLAGTDLYTNPKWSDPFSGR